MLNDDCAPILLRPGAGLADAMTRAAAEAGVSRQAWMLAALANAAADYIQHGAHPDDLPLWDEAGPYGYGPYGPTTCAPHGRTDCKECRR